MPKPLHCTGFAWWKASLVDRSFMLERVRCVHAECSGIVTPFAAYSEPLVAVVAHSNI
jgi:hypothetical protein